MSRTLLKLIGLLLQHDLPSLQRLDAGCSVSVAKEAEAGVGRYGVEDDLNRSWAEQGTAHIFKRTTPRGQE